MIRNILKMMKINHYIKNLVVFVPLIFSLNFADLKLFLCTLLMSIAFCFISSVVYIMNDLFDKEVDKNHPIKSKRPIASGCVSTNTAFFVLLLLFILSTTISYFINLKCLIIVLAYLLLNLAYSLFLKRVVLIDAACIALGFILRIVAGCFAIKVLPSPLVILMTFFVSQFFTFTKRKLEISLLGDVSNTRESIKELDISTANQFILINAILSISFYITYVLDAATIERAGTEYLYLTVMPFTLIIFRLYLLANSMKISDDPIIYLKKDKTIKYLFVLYLLVFFIAYLLLK